MSGLFKNIIKSFCFLLSFIINKKVIDCFVFIKNQIIWYAHKRSFKLIGENSFMMNPFSIKGSSCIRIGNDLYAGTGMVMEAA